MSYTTTDHPSALTDGAPNEATDEGMVETDALEVAGFEPIKRNSIPESELIEELERVATQLSESPTREAFDQHGEFCSQTYTNRFGSWNAALEVIDCEPNRDVDYSVDNLI